MRPPSEWFSAGFILHQLALARPGVAVPFIPPHAPPTQTSLAVLSTPHRRRVPGGRPRDVRPPGSEGECGAGQGEQPRPHHGGSAAAARCGPSAVPFPALRRCHQRWRGGKTWKPHSAHLSLRPHGTPQHGPGLPPPVPSPSPPAGFRAAAGVDHPAQDLRVLAASPAACRAACLAEPHCAAAVTDNTGLDQCWLKAALGAGRRGQVSSLGICLSAAFMDVTSPFHFFSSYTSRGGVPEGASELMKHDKINILNVFNKIH